MMTQQQQNIDSSKSMMPMVEAYLKDPQIAAKEVIDSKTKMSGIRQDPIQNQNKPKAVDRVIRSSTKMMKEQELNNKNSIDIIAEEHIQNPQEDILPEKSWLREALIKIMQKINEPKPKIKAEEVYKKVQGNETNYYLPCYVRLVVKEITHMNVAEMQAEVLGTLLFTFYYGDLDEKILSKFTHFGQNHKPIFLEFNKQEALQLTEGLGITIKPNQTKKTIQYVIRKRFKTSVIGDVFFTPFQIIQLYLSVTVQTLKFKVDNQKVAIKFNCMSHQQITNIISHENDISFGNYKIISTFTTALFTTSRGYPFQRDKYCCALNGLKDCLEPDRGNKNSDNNNQYQSNQSIDRQ